MELKSETYLNAAKKAKKVGDPRVAKFLQAYKDSIDKELMNIDGPSEGNDKIMDYYKKDKRGIQRLKALNKSKSGAHFTEDHFGTYLGILNTEIGFSASIYLVGNKENDRLIFLRQSLIDNDKWERIVSTLSEISDKFNNNEKTKPFTYVRVFVSDSIFDFFYFIDDDKIIPVSKNFEDLSSNEDYGDKNKELINLLCNAMNPSHKDI